MGSIRTTGCLAALVAAGMSFVLVGCGNDPHVAPWRQAREDGSPWRVAYRALGDDPRTLDPQVAYDTVSDAIISQLYESLLQYSLFQNDPYRLEPCLAGSMPERTRNADGTESYLFRLKPGIFFHDDPCFEGGRGREVVAEDLVYSFRRIADPEVECPVFSMFAEYIPGLDEIYRTAKERGRADYGAPLPGIEVLDSHSVRVHLKKPFPQILYWFAMPFTAPVPHEAVAYYDGRYHDGRQRESFRFKPVGTGAFRLAEWRRDRLMRMVRHERYTATLFPTGGWPAADAARFERISGESLPMVDEVQWDIVREAIPAWLMFRQGYLDRSGIGRDVFNTVLDAAHRLTPKYADRGVYLYRDVDVSTYYAVFNMEDPVVGKNRKLRQAISLAYDEGLANKLFRNGIDISAQQIIPPGVFGHDPEYRNPFKGPDLPRARELMAEAGYPGGIDPSTGRPLVLTLDLVADSSQARQMAEFEKNQIQQLGVRVEVEENTWAGLLEKMQRGQFQIYGSSGWHADYPDPENFYLVFYGENIPPSGANHGRYKNPEFDRLFEQMRQMDDGPERLEVIRSMRQILSADCPVVLFSHPVVYSLAQPWMPRIADNGMARNGMKYVQLDPGLRARKLAEWNRTPKWPVALALLVVAGLIGYGIVQGRKRDA